MTTTLVTFNLQLVPGKIGQGKTSAPSKPILAFASSVPIRDPSQARTLTPFEKWVKTLFEEEIFIRNQEGKDPRGERLKAISILRVRPSKAVEILKQGQIFGALRWNDKPLIADFFTPFHIEASNSGSSNLVFFLTTKNTHSENLQWAIDKNLIFLPGPPHLVIKNNFLRVLDDSIPWNVVELIQRGDCNIDLLRSEIEGICEDAVYIEKDSKSPPEEQFILPTPRLVLTDSSGAFANLMIDYRDESFHLSTYDDTSLKKSKSNRRQDIELQWEKDLIEAGFQKKQIGQSRYFCSLDKAEESIQLLLELGWKVQTHDGKILLLPENIDIEATEQDGMFTLTGKVTFGNINIPLEKTVPAVKRGDKTLPLNNGYSGFLSADKLKPLKELCREIICIGNSLALSSLKKEFLIESLPEAQITPESSQIQSLEQVYSFHGTLRPYQEEGLNWLCSLYKEGRSGLLADEMGLGKTVQLLAFISKIKGLILVVVPTSLVPNWVHEAQRFLPERSIVRYEGKDRINLLSSLQDDSIIVTSYTLARLDLGHLKKHEYALLVIDEAQMIKNSFTQTSQSLKLIPSQMRVSLTGTPIENALSDLISQFSFLEPELFSSTEFDKTNSIETLQHVKKLIKPFILRRKKEQVLRELPPLQEQTIYIEMEEEQRRVYDSFLSSFREGLIQKVAVDGLSKWRMQVFEALLRLRQICCAPQLLPEGFEAGLIPSAKIDLALEDIETLLHEKKKILLFSQFSSLLHLLSKKIGYDHLILEGASKNRDQIVSNFNDPNGQSILLSTLKAGGVGLNLQGADTVILFDPWWNGAVEMQAISRTHRIGREKPVFATRYIVQDSIEEHIALLRTQKLALQKAVFDGEEEIPLDMTEQILALLSR